MPVRFSNKEASQGKTLLSSTSFVIHGPRANKTRQGEHDPEEDRARAN